MSHINRLSIFVSILAICLLWFVAASYAEQSKPDITGNTKYQSFTKAKKFLLRKIYHDHRVTFYCGCEFTPDKNVSHSNGYAPKKAWKRAHRLEWEHIVPAHAHSARVSKSGVRGILNALTAKANHLKAATVPGRL